MKIVEVRIHSIKDKEDDTTQRGLKLAKAFGETLRRTQYAAFFCAPADRCKQTMEALGFSNYIVEKGFDTLPEEVNKWKPEAKGLESEFGEFGAFLEIKDSGLQGMIRSTGKRVLRTIKKVASQISENDRALVVSHGGALVPAIRLLKKDFDLREIGGRLKPCEGVEFYIENNEITGFKFLQHNFPH